MKIIPLTQGLFSLVDDKDYEGLIKHKWRAAQDGNSYYAKRGDNIRMHRQIMNAQPGQQIDHKDGYGLNNRRENLRFSTHQENMFNKRSKKNCTSQYKGVSYCRQTSKWKAGIQHNRERIHLGRFNNEILAAKAYDIKANELFKQFAKLNFPYSLIQQ